MSLPLTFHWPTSVTWPVSVPQIRKFSPTMCLEGRKPELFLSRTNMYYPQKMLFFFPLRINYMSNRRTFLCASLAGDTSHHTSFTQSLTTWFCFSAPCLEPTLFGRCHDFKRLQTYQSYMKDTFFLFQVLWRSKKNASISPSAF